MSARLAFPQPYAAWATVCFGRSRTGVVSQDDSLVYRSIPAVWRSDAAHGSVLVRSDPLLSSVGGHDYPSPCPHASGPLPCDVHLWVDADSPEWVGLTAHADVLVSRLPLPLKSAHRRVCELLEGHPACLAAAVPGRAMTCVIGVRDRTGAVSFVRPERCGSGTIPLHAVASVVHAWTVSGGSPCVLRGVMAMRRR